MKNKLTTLQRATLFAHVKNAAAECGEKPEAYRKRIMREELGVDHLSEVSRTDGFDRLMCRMLKDCGDYSHALDYVGGDIRRLRYLALSAARQSAAAHELEKADDIEIGAGATAAKLAAMGKKVTFLICTDGRYSMGERFDKGGTGWHYDYESKNGAAFMYNDDEGSPYYLWFISYENPLSLQEKLDYIKEKGIGGIIVWECSHDTPDYRMLNLMGTYLLENKG